MQVIFGENAPGDLDLDDSDQLRAYLKKTSPVPLEDLELALHEVVVRQILEDNPPLVWETAQRLHALRLARHKVFEQLSLALAPALKSLLDGDSEGFEERYTTNLRALPHASEMDIERTVEALLSRDVHVSLDDLQEQLRDGLDVTDPTGAVDELIESVLDRMLDDGLLELLAGDIVVNPEQLCGGIVLTTRMADGLDDWPPLDTDLAGFGAFTDEFGDPPADASPGQLLQARLRDDVVVVEPASEPPLDGEISAAIRRAYDIETEETGLPMIFPGADPAPCSSTIPRLSTSRGSR